MSKKTRKSLSFIISVTTALICQHLPAQALKINFSYDYGVTYEQKLAAELAALYWQDYLTDNATINIHLKMADATKLPERVLGGSIPAFSSNVAFSSVYNALKSDRTSGDDYTAIANLPTWNYWQWEGWNEGTSQQDWFKQDKINLTRANAKALGLIDRYSTDLDGVIVLSDLRNSTTTWQYDYLSSTVGSNKLDFTSVLIHEIAHTLGFVSVIDSINASNYTNKADRFKFTTTLDLYRKDNSNQTTGGAFISYGTDTYFSIDANKTPLAYFSTGTDTSLGTWEKGDGWQGSHWKRDANSGVLGIMDPGLGLNTRRGVSELDLRLLDVIGWNRDFYTTRSLSALKFDAQYLTQFKGNTSPATLIGNMLNQSRWGGTTTTTTYNQTQDLADYLRQEGLFQVGALWDTYDEAEPQQVPEPSTVLGLIGLSLLGLRLRKQKISYLG